MKDRIKEIRTQLNLTQAEFALRIGRTAGYISNLETGVASTSKETFHRIITEYNVNDLWLRSGKGERNCTCGGDKCR